MPPIAFLGRISVHRLTLYYLLVLLAAAAVFGLLGILPYSSVDLVLSTLLMLGVCWAVNRIFARAFGAASNPESVYITALILALIVTPVAPVDFAGIGFAVFASAWAMASKYIFAIGRRHVFNPAGFGVALAAIALGPSVSWWIGGNVFLLPIVLAGGVLILRKLRCFDLVLAFSGSALATVAVTSGFNNAWASVTQMLLHSMFFFFAFIMLTEPRTAPWGRERRLAYGAIVGFLFAPEIHLGSFYFTPEIALLIGNLFTVLASPGRWLRRPVVARP
jgi:Na+-transporting NADH:ubiquinone oxidoreductase subunit NqrB